MNLFDQWAQRIVQGDFLGRQTYHPLVNWMLATAPADTWNQWFGTAPVFLKAPLYAYLIALLRWLFGDPLLAMALLQILASTACAVLIFLITQRLFDTTAGVAAGLLFAVYAPAIHYDVVLLRGPWILLTGLVLTWQLVGFRDRPTAARSCAMGAITGLALLVNEGFLPLPMVVLTLVGWWIRDVRRVVVLGGWFLLGLVAVLTPLIARNVLVGVPPLSVAVTGSYALAMCNAADADPLFFRGPAASFVPLMQQSGGKMGRLTWLCLQSFHGLDDFLLFYLRRAVGRVVPVENPDNVNFYYATLKSPLLRWLPTYAFLLPLAVVGMWMGRRSFAALGSLLPVGLATIGSMMMTLPMSRYRVALAALLCPFAGVTIAQAIRWLRTRRLAALGAAAAGLVALGITAAQLERHVMFRNIDPRVGYYRLMDFRAVAQGYIGQQRFREASEEYLQLAQLTPVPSIRTQAWLTAAQLQVRAGDAPAARRSLQAVSGLPVNDAATLISIGDVWLGLGDATNALAAYRRAEALQPGGPLGAQLRNRLARFPAAPQS